MIPDFQSLMLPLLKRLADGGEYRQKQMMDFLSAEFALTDEEKNLLLRSGRQGVFDNRVGWAKAYLRRSGLLRSPRRGVFSISEAGLDVLRQKPERIDIRFLQRFPSFVEFQNPSWKRAETEDAPDVPDAAEMRTPEETLEAAHLRIRRSLAQELLDRVLELPPAFFERLVVELLVKMGYGGSISDAGEAIGWSGDEWVDGIIKEDRLGLDVIYIQAKRWKPDNTVGRPELQKFVGALAGKHAKKGVFITTSRFTREASEYLPGSEAKIVLVDGEKLAELMIEYGLGCMTQQTYEVKKIDDDYFSQE